MVLSVIRQFGKVKYPFPLTVQLKNWFELKEHVLVELKEDVLVELKEDVLRLNGEGRLVAKDSIGVRNVQ